MTAASEQDSDLRLVVVAGPNGSGKSTITAIHQELQCSPYIRGYTGGNYANFKF